jgi:hypothetical protein
MTGLRKSRIGFFIEFFNKQDCEKLESTLRYLSKKKKFPAFRKLTLMVDYKNLSQIKDSKTIINPPVILPNEAVEPK